MENIKKFDKFVNERIVVMVEQLILENTMDFIDQVEITETDISDFRQRQSEIIQRYPSLSDMDKDNITSRMNSIISSNIDSGDVKNTNQV